jgi:RNA polymerase sigma factor (TIGR02999 family)
MSYRVERGSSGERARRRSAPLTELLAEVRGGARGAADELFTVVYDDLKRIAHRQLSGQAPGRTLNTTALVHETYLKLVDRSRVHPKDRGHFFATAARAMRQILVDHARAAQAAKRGGGARRAAIEELASEAGATSPESTAGWAAVLGVDRALTRLSVLDERLTRVVELRFFAGFSVEEVAEILETSTPTVKRDWRAARAYLYRALSEDAAE